MRTFWQTKVLYSQEVLNAASKIKLTSDHFRNRVKVKGVTIDGPNARDLDDAIWVKKTDFGYQMDIHIADVVSLIDPSSILFKDALLRKTSRYYADNRVVHMFPPKLSKRAFSLLKRKKRLTITARIELNNDFNIINRRLFKSSFSSIERFTYDAATQGIQHNKSEIEKMLNLAYKLSICLLKKRFTKDRTVSRMSLESGYYIDKYGKQHKLNFPLHKNGATMVVQMFMVMANEMVAHYFKENKLLGIFRNQRQLTQKKIQRVIDEIKSSGDYSAEEVMMFLLQLSVTSSKYQIKSKGHATLKLKTYAHFTSPIRRSADLINHAVLHAHLKGQPRPFTSTKLKKIIRALNGENVTELTL